MNLRAQRATHRFRPALEALEDRFLLSYTITDVGTLGGDQSEVTAISGTTLAGSSEYLPANGRLHAFIYRNGVMTDLGTLGGSTSIATGVYRNMVVGGAKTTNDAAVRPFLWRAGRMHDLGSFGGSFAYAQDINSARQVVGYSALTGDQDTHAFLYEDGVMTDLGTLGGSDSSAQAINARGQVVGHSRLPTGHFHAFRWDAGVMTDLGTLGGRSSGAYAINRWGWITGDSLLPGETVNEAFLYKNGTMTGLGNLGGGYSTGYGINSQGQVVGMSQVAGTLARQAFLYTGGQMVNLNTLLPTGSGWDLQYAYSITDGGQIVGKGVNPEGKVHGYVLTPGGAVGESGVPVAAFSEQSAQPVSDAFPAGTTGLVWETVAFPHRPSDFVAFNQWTVGVLVGGPPAASGEAASHRPVGAAIQAVDGVFVDLSSLEFLPPIPRG